MGYSTVNVLSDARKLVNLGWTTGAFVRHDGGQVFYCSLGAVRKITSSSKFLSSAERMLDRAVSQWAVEHGKHDDLDKGIVSFNDTNGRTKEEVLEVFDIAKRLARKNLTARRAKAKKQK